MIAAHAAPTRTDNPVEEIEGAAAQNPEDEVRVFLGALATLMRDTVVRFEETVCRVTDLVTAQQGGAGRSLIVALQDFDRLQQEFGALGETLARYAAAAGPRSATDAPFQLGRDAIAPISVGDLKERLLRHLQGEAVDLDTAPPRVEEIF